MEEKVLTDEEKRKKREERRKRKKYRLLILLLLLLGTGVMLATSTYAWFTANKAVSISTLNVNIEAKNGIQISTDGTKWKSIIQKTDITGAHATYGASVNQLPDVLEPVSTGGVVNVQGRLPMYYGTIATSTSTDNEGEYILTAVPSVETESNGADSDGKFIAFDVFFKVEKETQIYITPDSQVKSTDVDDMGIKNASRIGFVVLGNTTAGDTVANIQKLNTGATSSTYIWEPNYNTHTAAGVANARDVYGVTVTDDGTSAIVGYSGVIADVSAADDVLLGNATEAKDSTKFKNVDIAYKTKNQFTHYIPVFTLANGVTKVRIYMWVEGQDVDCENNASGGNISFDLKITSELPQGAATAE
ncbi:MAG: hypothetical protein Q4C38_02635 [bacterium]|nr:hypothetical protein [bacterium]